MFLLLCMVFLTPVFRRDDSVAGFLVDIIYTLFLTSGIIALSNSRFTAVFSAFVVIVSSVFRIADYTKWKSDYMGVLEGVSTALCILLFIRAILIQVFKQGEITTNRLLGAVAVYILIGVLWADLYLLCNHLASGSVGAENPMRAEDRLSYLYFSFSVLTTVGFGDIVALSDTARSLVMAEAIIGQLFPTILLGRLVSLLVVKSR